VERKLAEGGYDARIVLQVHDELLIEVNDAQAQEVKTLVQETMRDAADLRVTLETDAHIGKSWLEAK
jgi:DNA polymerase I